MSDTQNDIFFEHRNEWLSEHGVKEWDVVSDDIGEYIKIWEEGDYDEASGGNSGNLKKKYLPHNLQNRD